MVEDQSPPPRPGSYSYWSGSRGSQGLATNQAWDRCCSQLQVDGLFPNGGTRDNLGGSGSERGERGEKSSEHPGPMTFPLPGSNRERGIAPGCRPTAHPFPASWVLIGHVAFLRWRRQGYEGCVPLPCSLWRGRVMQGGCGSLYHFVLGPRISALSVPVVVPSWWRGCCAVCA